MTTDEILLPFHFVYLPIPLRVNFFVSKLPSRDLIEELKRQLGFENIFNSKKNYFGNPRYIQPPLTLNHLHRYHLLCLEVLLQSLREPESLFVRKL